MKTQTNLSVLPDFHIEAKLALWQHHPAISPGGRDHKRPFCFLCYDGDVLLGQQDWSPIAIHTSAEKTADISCQNTKLRPPPLRSSRATEGIL